MPAENDETTDYVGRAITNIKKSSWAWKKEAHLFPRKNYDWLKGVDNIAAKYLFPACAPNVKPFTKHSKIITLGSCFAAEMREVLLRLRMISENIVVHEQLNSTFAILEYFNWITTGSLTDAGFGYQDKNYYYPEKERNVIQQAMERADGFIFTFGMSEVWYDKETGKVFWRGVPSDEYDERKQDCRLTTVQENEDAIHKIIDLCDGRPVILTVSPVPLNATNLNRPALVSDCVSKSILRVAVDNVIRSGRKRVYYWPSFELVKWCGAHFPFSTFKTEGNGHTARDVQQKVVKTITSGFVKAFVVQ